MKKRLFLAANQLPVHTEYENDKFSFEPLEENTISGLKDFYGEYQTKWIGLTGIEKCELSLKQTQELESNLLNYSCIPIFPDQKDYHDYLHGFSHNTIWPLFHYFIQNTYYIDSEWEAYKRVNQLFAEKILQLANEGDTVWVHDYHLMLLPMILKERMPHLNIGLFIHVPFPSYEIFRLLPWREEIMQGILGADLIGFHTYDYVRHLLSCVRRIFGHDTIFNRISIGERTLKVDALPKGINFDFFQEKAKKVDHYKTDKSTDRHKLIEQIELNEKQEKIILSIDKMNYSKGIPARLKAFELFLQENPEYLEKVSLILLALSTEEHSRFYESLRREVDEMVGRINGNYGTITWMPVRYLNREFTIDELVDIYSMADIALIMPLRDGMNVVAKEFVASRYKKDGVLILSEMAGASKELHESIIVNPNNLGEVVNAIYCAINMPKEEQVNRMTGMQERLKRYTVDRWAREFIGSLEGVIESQKTRLTKKISSHNVKDIIKAYKNAKKRMIFLDYDGTLSGFKKNPKDAKPDQKLYDILANLVEEEKNTVAIISGRDKETLGKWFGPEWNLHFIAEHGVWLREPGSDWHMLEQIDNQWKESVIPMLEYYVDQTPRSFIEHKNFSVVWHYRKADPDLGVQRAWELKDELRTLTSNLNLEIMDGDKVLEIKYSGINKGRAALQKMGNTNYDFIFAVGDDWTDEYTFESMPEEAFTVKVGTKNTAARYYIEGVEKVRELLDCFHQKDCK
ncbi:MAG TPA: bifunctional alpha,alpha-trehalose-phosphate synthase (UDP-forming)/trehalose-phosphatase [Bacteroidales bacterium]|nr:bifunctional alpha,alpha-trehalose-phosphate synthase (UDP-forming)/trehalose-phosphatase [Bacteroidales bacterium]